MNEIIIIGVIFPCSVTWLEDAQEFSYVSRYKAFSGLEKEKNLKLVFGVLR